MTVEEKAKAYDEAIKRAKVFKEHLLEINDKGYVDEMDYIFPELKESEDEEIRKFLIQMAQNGHGEDRDWWNKCVAWLEKQGEQKPIASSKFKVGDKVVHKGTGKLWTVHWYIKEDNVYSVKDSEGLIHIYSPDVLELIEQKPAEWSEEDEVGLGDAMWAIQQARTIAKDENDMGNLWHAERWLKSLKDKVCCEAKCTTTKEWREEDERDFDVIRGIIYNSCNAEDASRLITWLKSLKDRYTWKPSDEQMKALQKKLSYVNVDNERVPDTTLESLYNDLEKL